IWGFGHGFVNLCYSNWNSNARKSWLFMHFSMFPAQGIDKLTWNWKENLWVLLLNLSNQLGTVGQGDANFLIEEFGNGGKGKRTEATSTSNMDVGCLAGSCFFNLLLTIVAV
ncbi:hypothetical protein ACJX0J_042487, partial [Zea mays]